jgi:hypothetical protein
MCMITFPIVVSKMWFLHLVNIERSLVPDEELVKIYSYPL